MKCFEWCGRACVVVAFACASQRRRFPRPSKLQPPKVSTLAAIFFPLEWFGLRTAYEMLVTTISFAFKRKLELF